MDRENYQRYLQSEFWAIKREAHFRKHSYCQVCGMSREQSRDLYHQDLEVHHISYRNVGNERPADLQTLCQRHHEELTFGLLKDTLESIGVRAWMLEKRSPSA